MYKTKDITTKELKALQVINQDEIEELTGSKLNPAKAWEVIKDASDNFKNKDVKAMEADQLLYEMLNPEMKKSKKPEGTKEIIRLQEKERARALELLELELLIAA
ncbi:hypothetical protein R5N98_12605 [Tenacibaculum maritimum]|uniref:hypothetical protein n=1 Tax=Tenacibaculum maritimum TaxID=107401 RepID=UPI00388E6B8A